MVALLISCGHQNAWDYGFSFFLTACESLVELQKQQMVTFAGAIGLVLGGEDARKALFSDARK